MRTSFANSERWEQNEGFSRLNGLYLQNARKIRGRASDSQGMGQDQKNGYLLLHYGIILRGNGNYVIVYVISPPP